LVAAGFGPYVSLAPLSAAAALYPNCLQLSFDGGVNTNVIPKVTTPPTATWISEGSPSTIVQSVYGTVQVGPPRKLLFGAAVTGELQRYGPDTALQIIQRTLIDAATSALDSALLDATAADATRPAGLLNGVSDLGATAGANLTALITDLAKLAGAISDAKIDAESLVLIMNSRQAIVLRGLLTGPKFDRYTIIGTPALSAGTVVAVAPAGIALYLSPPQIEVSGDGLVHMDSSAPRNIDTQAVGETVKSAWQANLLLLKIRMRATWAPLAAAAVQKIDSATW
jgi:hypothetical protein